MHIEYTGTPLSMLGKLPIEQNALAHLADVTTLWCWYPLKPQRLQTPESVDQLVAGGYKQGQEAERSFITSQLYDIHLITPPIPVRGEVQFWYKPKEHDHLPVILCFPLPDTTISIDRAGAFMLNYLPPPQMGEYAFVIERQRQKAQLYKITELPLETRQRWVELGKRLQALAAPSTHWLTYTDKHLIASDPVEYQRQLNQLTTEVHLTIGKTRSSLLTQQRILEAAFDDVHNLQLSLDAADWQEQWEGIQQMAKDLALAYWKHHQSQNEKAIPDIAHIFKTGVSEAMTSLPFQAYPYAVIAPKGDWREITSEQEHEVVIAFQRSKKSGTAIVQVRGDATGQNREMVRTNLSEQVKKLSDLDSDVFLAMVAQLQKGHKDEGGNTWITASQILDYRGIVPIMKPTNAGQRRAGHRQEDIEAISRCISSMENTWIRVYEQEIIDSDAGKGKKRGRSKITRESRLFMFGDIIYHHELGIDGTQGKSYPIAWQYRESNWMLPFLEGPNRFTGILLQKTLNYDPHNELWEKRLAKHFMVYLRLNASHHEKPPIKIQTLFDELNLPINERFPQRTRDRFEKAMDILQKDGHLIWDYQKKEQPPSRNWLATWLGYHIVVESPEQIKNQYLPIANHAQVVRSQNRIQRKSGGKKRGKTAKRR